MRLHFLNSDRYHIKPNNQPSLFGFLHEYRIPCDCAPNRPELENRFGDYREVSALLNDAGCLLDDPGSEELWRLRYRGFALFPLLYREALSFAVKRVAWPDGVIPNDMRAVFDRLYAAARPELLLNYAAAVFWLRHWLDFFRTRRGYTHCLLYSGSDIKTATLLEFLRTYRAEPVVLETFYTGSHYYMERLYESVPNRSELRFANYYRHQAESNPPTAAERAEAARICRSIDSVFSRLNREPDDEVRLLPAKGKKTVLVLGQVRDDYSIINSGMDDLSSIGFYQRLLRALAERSGYSIIFKAHPWEREKLSTRGLTATCDSIRNFCANELAAHADRIAVVEKYPLADLLERADWVVSINSQSVLEAAFAGCKGIVFGNPFYGGKGFTWDCSGIDECVNGMLDGTLRGTLTLGEYGMFEQFMAIAFRHLMPKKRDSYDALWSRLPGIDDETIAQYRQRKIASVGTREQNALRLRLRAAFKRFRADPYGYLGRNRRRYLHPFKYLFFWMAQ